MNEIILTNEDIYKGNLILVNSDYALKEDKSKKLIPAIAGFDDILLREDAAYILRQVLKDINSGDSIVPVSGYRSSEEQTEIFEGSMIENGEEFTRKFVALPFHSEHQTGLAIDLGLNMENIDFICPEFPYEGICQTFREQAPHYGFILRYAGDKEKITGISHEPWHFRYVGCPHAEFITENNMAFEEYIEFIKKYTEDNRLKYKDCEIYYVKAEGETSIKKEENRNISVSGNNTDGFIVTSALI